jgi:hypothetical protein
LINDPSLFENKIYENVFDATFSEMPKGRQRYWGYGSNSQRMVCSGEPEPSV